jgi:hypothetical protein
MADKGGDRDIYGREPSDGVDSVVGPVLKDQGKLSSNAINGKVNDSRDSRYEPEDGK